MDDDVGPVPGFVLKSESWKVDDQTSSVRKKQ